MTALHRVLLDNAFLYEPTKQNKHGLCFMIPLCLIKHKQYNIPVFFKKYPCICQQDQSYRMVMVND